MSKPPIACLLSITALLMTPLTVSHAATPNVTAAISKSVQNPSPPLSASDFKSNVKQLDKQNQDSLHQQVKDGLSKNSATPTTGSATGTTGTTPAPAQQPSQNISNGSTQQNYNGFQTNSNPSSGSIRSQQNSAAPAANSSGNTNSNSQSNSNSGGSWDIKY